MNSDSFNLTDRVRIAAPAIDQRSLKDRHGVITGGSWRGNLWVWHVKLQDTLSVHCFGHELVKRKPIEVGERVRVTEGAKYLSGMLPGLVGDVVSLSSPVTGTVHVSIRPHDRNQDVVTVSHAYVESYPRI